MNPAQLITWLKDPALLDKDSLLPLRSLIDDYPCFTAARMLYLKNLAQLNDVRYTSELVRAAVSVPDRRKLYLFMENRPASSLPGMKTADQSENRDFSLIDRFLHHVSVQEDDEELELSDQYLKPEDLAGETGDSPASETETSPTGPVGLTEDSPVEAKGGRIEAVSGVQDKTPVATFEEDFGVGAFSLDYLNYQELYDKEGENTEQHVAPKPMQGQDLIDAYLSSGHEKLEAGIAAKADQAPTISEEEALETLTSGLPEASFSEALARIYVKQKRYARALEIIKSLSLKYPEKNRYFADQIRYLEQLINSTNQY